MNHLGTGRPEPAYVERGGEICFRLPFRSCGARIHFFYVQGDESKLHRYLERTYNRPSGGVVKLRPAGPYVLVNFIKVSRLVSGEPDRALGGVEELEASIWVPALRSAHGVDRVVWTVPYMFVDSGQALASGREVYGYPKQLGSPDIRELADGTPDELLLETLALARFGPDELAQKQRVLKVQRVGAHLPGRSASVEDLGRVTKRLKAVAPEPDEIVEFIRGVLEAGESDQAPDSRPRSRTARVRDQFDLTEITFRLYSDLVDSNLNMLLLKQFRSAVDPERACYQAILEVSHRLSGLDGWTLHRDQFDVTFDAVDSQHMQEELGVSNGTQRAALAVSIDFEFEVQPARILWQAPTD